MRRVPAPTPCWGLLLVALILAPSRVGAGGSASLPHGRPPPSPSSSPHHVRILTPHDHTVIRTDKLLVVVDVSGLGVPLRREGGGAMICLALGPILECSHDYQLGGQGIGAFARMLDVRALPPSPSHTLTALAVTSQSQGDTHQVYDSFIFFDELDLLELRLKELDPVVDGFILIESDITHSRLPKPLHFQERKHEHRFAPYADRIIHVVLPAEYLLHGTGPSHWDRETKQRDALVAALRQYRDTAHGTLGGVPMPGPKDLIMISDVDEVPRREVVEELQECEEAVFPTMLLLDWHLYSLKWKATIPWGIIAKEGSVVVTADLLLHDTDGSGASANGMAHGDLALPPSPTACRRLLRPTHLPQFASLPIAVFTSAGWHFSSFGGAQWLRNKFASYADHVYNRAFLLEPGRLERLLHFGVPYFYLDAFSTPEDNFFLTANITHPRDLPYAIQDRDGLSQALKDFLWPADEAWRLPDVTDERLLRQDLLQARYFLGNETRMTLPGSRRKPSTSFTYNCHSDYRVNIHEFCTRISSPDCHQLLSDAVEKDCAASVSASHSLPHGDASLDIFVEDSQLVPTWLFNRTFIVEYMAGDNSTTAARRVCEEYQDKMELEACVYDLQNSLQRRLLGQQPATGTSSAPPPTPPSDPLHAGSDSRNGRGGNRPAPTPSYGESVARKRAALMAPVLFPQLYPGCGRITHPPLPTTPEARRALAQGQHEIDLKLYYHLFANDTKPGVFLEIGAADGKFLSNTYFYEHALGWRGILVEPQPANAAQLMKSYRPRSARFTAAACTIANDEEAGELELTDGGGVVAHSPAFVTAEYQDEFAPELLGSRLVKVPCVPLQYMIDSTGLFDIDLFSLDVEGGEMAVLETVDLDVTNIRVLLVEMGRSASREKNNEEIRSHLAAHGFVSDEMCKGKHPEWCAYSELFVNPLFEARKASRPPLPIHCEKYHYEGWAQMFGHMSILNLADHSCHVISLVARDGVLESPEAIAARSCHHMRANTGATGPCSPLLVVNTGEDEDCIPRLTALIERVIRDNNAYGLKPPVLLPVDVGGVREYFFARSNETVEEDAAAFCRTAAIDLSRENCAAPLTAAVKEIYASRPQH